MMLVARSEHLEVSRAGDLPAALRADFMYAFQRLR
jgi:hypothetical protein